nr:PC4/YdbC family ssDNA-binding protein [Clostridium sp.]
MSESSKGWKKELNLISWNDKEAKYDLRDWAPDHEKMAKGITLSLDELMSLKELLKIVSNRYVSIIKMSSINTSKIEKIIQIA